MRGQEKKKGKERIQESLGDSGKKRSVKER